MPSASDLISRSNNAHHRLSTATDTVQRIVIYNNKQDSVQISTTKTTKLCIDEQTMIDQLFLRNALYLS